MRYPTDGYKASSKIFHYQAADEYKHNLNITALVKRCQTLLEDL